MYETTVSVASDNIHLLDYVAGQIQPCINEIDGLSTRVDGKKRSYYSLACADTYRFALKRTLTETVSQALGLGYKNIFVRNLLHIDADNFYQNVLVNTVCVFDCDCDRQAIVGLIDADSPICLDGYYNFRLNDVKRKWHEVIRLISDNFYVLRDNRLITEFLQYLTEALPAKVKKLSVSVNDGGFVLYGTDGKVLPQCKSLSPCYDWRQELALNVLYFKPRQLTLYAQTPVDGSLYRLMDSLFDLQVVNVI